MRFYLVDRIDEYQRFAYALGTKCVTLSDDPFEHHFPGQPVYPGALLIESLAQLGGALIELSLRDTLDYCPRSVLGSVKAKFREFARPGDALSLRVDLLSHHSDSALVRGRANRGDVAVCEADLVYGLLRVDDPRLEAERREYLKILTRGTRVIEST